MRTQSGAPVYEQVLDTPGTSTAYGVVVEDGGAVLLGYGTSLWRIEITERPARRGR